MPEVIARESPWGAMVVLDAHVHFFSRNFFELIGKQAGGRALTEIQERTGWDIPGEPAELADLWARDLDYHGVHRAALMASLPGDEGSVIAAAQRHPDRFIPFAMVNPHAFRPEALNGIRVACLFPAMHLYSVHDEIVKPVFEWAEQNGRAVFVHCGTLSVGIRDLLGLPSPFDIRYSNPIDLHAVARRYPSVPVIVPHFGAGYFREALMVADLCPNIYLDTSSSNRWIRYEGSHIDLRQVFRRALDVVGPKRLLFGSDSSYFPRGWHHQIFDEQAKALYEIGLHAEDARGIFGENLLRLFAR